MAEYHLLLQPDCILLLPKNIQPTFFLPVTRSALKLASVLDIRGAKGTVQVREEAHTPPFVFAFGERGRRFPFGVLGEIEVIGETDFEEVEDGVRGEEAGYCQGDLNMMMGVSVQGSIKLVRWMRGRKGRVLVFFISFVLNHPPSPSLPFRRPYKVDN